MDTTFLIEIGHDKKSWDDLVRKFDVVLDHQEKIEQKFMDLGKAARDAFGKDLKDLIKSINASLGAQNRSLGALIKKYKTVEEFASKARGGGGGGPVRGGGRGGVRQRAPAFAESELTLAGSTGMWFADRPPPRRPMWEYVGPAESEADRERQRQKLAEEEAFRAERILRNKKAQEKVDEEIRKEQKLSASALKKQQEHIVEIERELNQVHKLMERIRRLAEEPMTPLQERQLKKLREQAGSLARDMEGGVNKKEVRAYRREIRGLEKDFRGLGKSVERVNRHGEGLLRTFDMIGIRMSGIAATIFVFEQVRQMFEALMRPSLEFEQILIDLRKEFGSTGDNLNEMREAARQAELSGAMGISEAIDMLREFKKEGDNSEDAIYRLRLESLRMEKIMAGTMTQTWRKFGAEVKDVSRSFGQSIPIIKKIMDSFSSTREHVRDLEQAYKNLGITREEAMKTPPWATSPSDLDLVIAREVNRIKEIRELEMQTAEELLKFEKLRTAERKKQDELFQRGPAQLHRLFQITGQTTGSLLAIDEDAIMQQVKALASRLEKDSPLIDIFQAELEYQRAQKYLEPTLKLYEDYYRRTGKMIQQYYDERLKQIDHDEKINTGIVGDEISKRISEHEKFQLFVKKFYADNVGLSQQTIRILEESFRKSGFMSDKLIKKRQADMDLMEIRMKQAGAAETQILTARLKEELRLFDDMNKALLQMDKEYLGATKRMTENYRETILHRLQLVEALRVAMGFDPIEAAEITAAQERAILQKEQKPFMQAYQKFYDDTGKIHKDYYQTVVNTAQWAHDEIMSLTGDQTMAEAAQIRIMREYRESFTMDTLAGYRAMYAETGTMTEKQLQYEIRAAEISRDTHIRATGDKVAAEEAYFQKVERLQIRMLEQSEDVADGLEAVRRKAALNAETVAQKTIDRVNRLMSSTESAIEDQIFGTLQMEFESMQDWFENLASGFSRMVNRMIAEALAARLMQHLFGGLYEGGRGPGLLSGAMDWFTRQFGEGRAPAPTAIARPPSPLLTNELSKNTLQHGGVLGEGVFGIGRRSGESYEFHPNEVFMPMRKLGGAPKTEIYIDNTISDIAEVQAQSEAPNPNDLERMVTNIIIKRKNTDPSFRDALGS